MNKDETVAFTRKVMSHLCGPNQVRGGGELPAWEQRLFVTQLSRKTQDILAEVGHQRVKMRCVLCIFLNFNVNHFQFNSFRHLLAEYDCMYCGFPMASKEECRRHLQSDCKTKPTWDWLCNTDCMYCGLEFETGNDLKKHIVRWRNEKPLL